MKNIRVIEVEKLKDTSNFRFVEKDIYKDLKDNRGSATYRIALAMELEQGENSQYPLEDILDEYLVHVEESFSNYDATVQKNIFGGDLEGVQKLKSIVGKRAYNKEFINEEGQTRIGLVIE